MNSVIDTRRTRTDKADHHATKHRTDRPTTAKVQIPELYSRPAGGRDLQGCMKARA